MAGEVSKDLTQRVLLPEDVVAAHNEGLIHFHDSDYFAQHMHNCDLVNLEDMLQNSTSHLRYAHQAPPITFSTACNIATRSSPRWHLAVRRPVHLFDAPLAPFVEVSRRKRFAVECRRSLTSLALRRTRKKYQGRRGPSSRWIRRGVRPSSTRSIAYDPGQAPFVTVVHVPQRRPRSGLKRDLAMIIRRRCASATGA